MNCLSLRLQQYKFGATDDLKAKKVGGVPLVTVCKLGVWGVCAQIHNYVCVRVCVCARVYAYCEEVVLYDCAFVNCICLCFH